MYHQRALYHLKQFLIAVVTYLLLAFVLSVGSPVVAVFLCREAWKGLSLEAKRVVQETLMSMEVALLIFALPLVDLSSIAQQNRAEERKEETSVLGDSWPSTTSDETLIDYVEAPRPSEPDYPPNRTSEPAISPEPVGCGPVHIVDVRF